MARITVISLPRCLKCTKRFTSMVQVGPMVFCGSCYIHEFLDHKMESEIDPATKEYQKWIKHYNKVYG